DRVVAKEARPLDLEEQAARLAAARDDGLVQRRLGGVEVVGSAQGFEDVAAEFVQRRQGCDVGHRAAASDGQGRERGHGSPRGVIGGQRGQDAPERDTAEGLTGRTYQPCSWRSPSYRTMPTAVARLRLRTLPAGIGMTKVRPAWRCNTSS